MGILKFQFGKGCDISEILRQFNFRSSEVTVDYNVNHKEGCEAFTNPTTNWFVPTTTNPGGSCVHLFSEKTTLDCKTCGSVECTVQRKVGNCFILKTDSGVNYAPVFVQIKKENLNPQLAEKAHQLKRYFLYGVICFRMVEGQKKIFFLHKRC